jgi:diguanylate cyclase (GGDEF)-like protein
MNAIDLLIHGLTITGTCILVLSLFPIRRLMANLPRGKVRSNWRILRILIFFFIAGYLAYTVFFWSIEGTILELVVPAVFFLGACFVWLVNTLSLQTAIDLRRVADLEVETITDPLTGIYNRRYLDRRLKQEVDRALRYDLSLSVLMLDIDHFKNINDTYGHQAGDLVLSSLGKLIMGIARTSDIVARYGGEEFLVIGTSTPLAAAPVFAERLRRTVEITTLVPASDLTNGEDIRVTISIGVAALGPENGCVSALVKAADIALYRAKLEGRTRVVVSGVE